jgi:hypothetical protein
MDELGEGFAALAPSMVAEVEKTDQSKTDAATSKAMYAVAKAKADAAPSDAVAAAELADSKTSFREKAGIYKANNANLAAKIKEVAASTKKAPEDIARGLGKYLEEKDAKRIRNIFLAQQTLDLCFAIDATGSMGASMTGVRETVRSIVGEMQEGMQHLKARLALVIYRDDCDGKDRFAIHDFSGSINEFETFLEGQKPKGGGDACEDAIGGLDKVTELKWMFLNRILIHIADAPCHGRQYHGDECGDNHKDGIFDGSKRAEDVIPKLQQHNVQYTFLRINSSTDKMIQKFNEIAGSEYIVTNNINPRGLGADHPDLAACIKRSIVESVRDSLNRSFSASSSDAEGKMRPKTYKNTVNKALLTVFEEEEEE